MVKAKPAPQVVQDINIATYNRDFASGRLRKYDRQYVAYDDGIFLGSGSKSDELERRVRQEWMGIKNLLIRKVEYSPEDASL